MPSGATTTIGPESRIHESSIGIATTSTVAPQWPGGIDNPEGSATIVTGSNRAIVWAISAYTDRAPVRPASPHNPISAIRTVGQAMIVRS